MLSDKKTEAAGWGAARKAGVSVMNIRFLLQHTAALALATGVSAAQAADYEPAKK